MWKLKIEHENIHMCCYYLHQIIQVIGIELTEEVVIGVYPVTLQKTPVNTEAYLYCPKQQIYIIIVSSILRE